MAVKAGEIDGLELINRIDVLALQPGDVLVLRSEELIRPEFKLYLEKQLRRRFPEHQVIVIDGGVELMVLREEPEG